MRRPSDSGRVAILLADRDPVAALPQSRTPQASQGGAQNRPPSVRAPI
jgi:hypothetical protein